MTFGFRLFGEAGAFRFLPDATQFQLQPGVGLFAEPRKRLRFLKRPRPPSGGETATALLSGIVERTEMRRNMLTDVDFAWARVRSYGGVTFDLVTPPAQVTPTFAPGAIVQTLVWLVGSVELD